MTSDKKRGLIVQKE